MPALYSLGNYNAPQNGTRWFELRQSVQIVLEAHEAVGLPTDIYFLNRGTYRDVTRFSDIEMFSERVNSDHLEKPVIVHIFTDGHPTNDVYREDINDDEDIESSYRPMEYRVRGQFGWTGPTRGIQGVDVTEDYRGELRDVRRLRGYRYPFSFGDYIVKCLLGCVIAELHMIDLPNGVSIYSGGFGNNQGCCVIMSKWKKAFGIPFRDHPLKLERYRED
eukprot:TRINITY_DN1775_c0_g1_i6.p1 TRINITY_DN1775_c0_g1~~TRINITY_DN1775_c0_g1_i6.p1  ORF type:complete len:219 (-),score=9.32 TRINITY_DN1775_c0_g1_i6:268-924(-)